MGIYTILYSLNETSDISYSSYENQYRQQTDIIHSMFSVAVPSV
jgi:hypothetical protein